MSLSQDQLELARQQFGPNAENYVASPTHAKGKSLELLVEAAAPQATDRVLDIATGAGHVARVLSPHVAEIVASDVTVEMLHTAEKNLTGLGITNVTYELADAHELPFPDDSFDLVTCRIAPHHFSNPARFVWQAARVCRPGGRVIVVDNIASHDREVAEWCDDFERQRDPSHVRCLPLEEWTEIFTAADLVVTHVEVVGKEMSFDFWTDNMSVQADERVRLLAMLASTPASVAAWLRPRVPPDVAPQDAGFTLTEGIVVGTKPSTPPPHLAP